MARKSAAQLLADINAVPWDNGINAITGPIIEQFKRDFLDSFSEGLLTTGESIDSAIQLLKTVSAITTFLELTDTPDSYANQGGKKLIVDEVTGELIFAPSTTSSGFYEPSTAALGIVFDGTNLTLSGTNKFVVANGTEFEKTNDTIAVTPYEGIIYIYYDNNGNLQQVNGLNRNGQYTQMLQTLPVSYLLYNSNAITGYTFVGDYLKGRSSNKLWVKNFYDREVSLLQGLVVGGSPWGGGNADADAQLSLSEGELIFTDRKYNSPSRALADTWNVGYFDNTLRPVGIENNPFLCLTDVVLGIDTTGRIVYNNNGIPAVVSSGNFVWYFIVITNDITPVDRSLSYMGNQEYGNLTNAEAGLQNEVATIETRLPIRQGAALVYGVLLETKSTFSNAVKSRIVEVLQIEKGGTTGSPTVSVPDDLINGSDASFLHNHNSLYVTLINAFFRNIADTLSLNHNIESLTANRTLTWPDKSGTPALTDDTQFLQMQFDSSVVTPGDPGQGKVRTNSSDQSLVTELYFNENEYLGEGKIGDFLGALSADSIIGFKALGNRAKWANYKVVSATFTTYWTVVVTVESKGSDFSNNDVIGVSLLGVGGGSSATTVNIKSLIDLSSTTEADPGTGKVRFNGSDQSLISSLFYNDFEYETGVISDMLSTLGEDAVIEFKSENNPNKWANYQVVSITKETGYSKVDILVLNKGVDFENGDIVGVIVNSSSTSSESKKIGWQLLSISDLQETKVLLDTPFPQSVIFTPERDKMFICSATNNTIDEYSLQNPAQINPSVFLGQLDLSSISGIVLRSFRFSYDGLKIFAVDGGNAQIIEIPLSTPYVVTSADVPNAVYFNIPSPSVNCVDIFWNTDGSKFYLLDFTNVAIYQFTAGGSFSIASSIYDNVSFDLSNESTKPFGFYFKTDGSQFWVVNTDNDTIYEYNLDGGFGSGVDTAIYSGNSLDLSSLGTAPSGVAFSETLGFEMYITEQSSTSIYQFKAYTETVGQDRYYVGFESKNVVDFGALGDGTDQTVAINTAISTMGNGGTLVFNPGTYRITSDLVLNNIGDIKIIGQNAELINDIATPNYKLINAANLGGLDIDKLRININGRTNLGRGISGSSIEGVVSFKGVHIYNFGNIETRGIYLEEIANDPNISGADEYPGALISDCKFYNKRDVSRALFDYSNNNAIGIAIEFNSNAEYWRVIGCNFRFITSGVFIEGGANGTIIGNEFLDIDARASKSSTVSDYGCVYQSAIGSNNGKLTIVGNKFNHNYAASIKSDYVNTVRPITISDNHFIANAYDAIQINGTDRTRIHGNFFNRAYNYVPWATYPFTGTRQMILLNNASRCSVFNNDFETQTGNAITSLGTSDYNKIAENTYNAISGSFASLVGANNIERTNDNI